MKKILLAFTFLAQAAFAQQEAQHKQPFTVKDFLSIPILTSPVSSPDGSKVVYCRIERDLKKNTYTRSLYIIDSGKVKRLTGKGHSDWGAFWAKDGKGLYFSSDRAGRPAFYLNRFDGTDPETVFPPRKGGMSGIQFSPDGKYVAFTARPKKAKGFGSDPEVHTTLQDMSKWPQLWIRDLKTKKEKQLTRGKVFVYQFDWSPKSDKLVFTADPKGDSDVTEDHFLALVDLKGKVEVLADNAVQYSHPKFSPEGKRLSFLRDRHEKFGYYVNVADLFVMDLESRKIVSLTAGQPFDLGDGEWSRWSNDGRWIWFLAGQRAKKMLFKIPAAGGKPRVTPAVSGSFSSISFSDDEKSAFASISSFSEPLDLFRVNLLNGKQERLTNIRGQVGRFKLSRPLTLNWTSPDGTKVEGFLFLPPGKGDEKVPMVVEIHGGPGSVWHDSFSFRYLWYVFASKGWATLIPNIRGSQTYGEEFLRGNLADFGGGDFTDVLAGVDKACDTANIDRNRLAISGYSYGGFMANMAVTKTNIFKAAVGIAGGFNFLSCFGQSNSVLPEVYYDPLGSPEKLLKAFRDSPVASIHKVKTPLLLIHGKADRAVNCMQSIEYFTMLQLLKKSSKLILYPGEGHGINKPSHMLHYMKAEIDWIEKYVK